MKLAVVLHAHENAKLVDDTVLFLKKNATDNIMILADGKSTKWIDESVQRVPYVVGFRNKTQDVFRNHSLYRNHILGLIKVYESFPDCDWYCSTEYDTLFCTEDFKKDLLNLSEDVWLAGFNERRTFMSLPYLEHIVGQKIYSQSYFIGCCMFFRREFLKKAKDLFDRVLIYTNGFDCGFFPNYWNQEGYDFTECLAPTLVKVLGGKTFSFSKWSSKHKVWAGDYERYPIRWPEPMSLHESKQASIVHPVKSYEDPIREYYRKRI